MMETGTLALGCNTVGLGPVDVAKALRLLCADERARYDRLGFAEDRRDYVAAHALLRIALGRVTDTAPEELRFDTTALGKPFLIPSRRERPPSLFSLAHSRGYVACVIGLQGPLGVDVEPVARNIRAMEIARRVLSDEESSALEHCRDDERAARFCELWTLKEAFAKARGDGLTFPMRLPALDIVAGCLHVRCPPDWSFVLVDLQGTHKLAVATYRAPRAHVREVDALSLTRGTLEQRADPLPVRSWTSESLSRYAICHSPARFAATPASGITGNPRPLPRARYAR
jgi:4'-phosphopantetheinyl transferase